MKVRDSGMPPEEMWSGFFGPGETLRRFGLSKETGDVADFGSGYGTFAIPAAQMISGSLHAFDIEEAMIDTAKQKARAAGIMNIIFHHHDFVALGTGLANASIHIVLLFNILHAEDPLALLHETRRILRPDGSAAIMHWIPDSLTPRGPSLDIRPTPEQCRDWALAAGFASVSDEIALPPYHYGLICRKAG